jgi:hypothetical protein
MAGAATTPPSFEENQMEVLMRVLSTEMLKCLLPFFCLDPTGTNETWRLALATTAAV